MPGRIGVMIRGEVQTQRGLSMIRSRRLFVLALPLWLLATACHSGEINDLRAQVLDLGSRVNMLTAKADDLDRDLREQKRNAHQLRKCLGLVLTATRDMARDVRFLDSSYVRDPYLPNDAGYIAPASCAAVIGKAETTSLRRAVNGAYSIVDRVETERWNATNPPPVASAICRDGTKSYSQHAQGTCSHHDGVDHWVNYPG